MRSPTDNTPSVTFDHLEDIIIEARAFTVVSLSNVTVNIEMPDEFYEPRHLLPHYRQLEGRKKIR